METMVKKEREQANRSNYEKARSDKDRIRTSRKSPDVRNMYCLKVGSAEFYFVTEERMNRFWNGDQHTKGFRQKLIDENGKKYFDGIEVEMYKR